MEESSQRRECTVQCCCHLAAVLIEQTFSNKSVHEKSIIRLTSHETAIDGLEFVLSMWIHHHFNTSMDSLLVDDEWCKYTNIFFILVDEHMLYDKVWSSMMLDILRTVLTTVLRLFGLGYLPIGLFLLLYKPLSTRHIAKWWVECGCIILAGLRMMSSRIRC